jgi:hypothetical protein
MIAAELVPGAVCALRERRDLDWPTERVEVVGPKPRAGKVKIRRLDGDHEGLEEWVPTRYLLCAWEERDACLHDERAEAALRQDQDDQSDKVMRDAIVAVMESTGEQTASFWNGWSDEPAVIKRLWTRAGLTGNPLHHHHLAYKDRRGRWHLPYGSALTFATAFAKAEPESVLMHVDAEEREMRSKGYQPGESTWHTILTEYRPAYAVVREWAGGREDVARLTKEIERLHGLLSEAEWALRKAGDERGANRLRRAVGGE